MTSSTILVTGANGFVGSQVARRLAEAGRPVLGLVRKGRSPAGKPPAGLQFRSIDEWTSPELTRVLEGVNAVVHAASVVHRPGASNAEYDRFNREGTAALIAACRARGVGRLLFLSSIKVYGENPGDVIDERTAVVPEGGYASTKVDAERLVLEGARDSGPSPVVLRLCPVYGRGDKGNVKTMIRAISRRRFLLPGDGTTRKSIVHVSTVSDVVHAAIDSSASGTFVVADRETPSMRRLADSIARAVGRRRPTALPIAVVRGLAACVEVAAGALHRRAPITRSLIDKSLTSTICSPRLAETTFGLQCHVDLDASIDDEVAWLRAEALL